MARESHFLFANTSVWKYFISFIRFNTSSFEILKLYRVKMYLNLTDKYACSTLPTIRTTGVRQSLIRRSQLQAIRK